MINILGAQEAEETRTQHPQKLNVWITGIDYDPVFWQDGSPHTQQNESGSDSEISELVECSPI